MSGRLPFEERRKIEEEQRKWNEGKQILHRKFWQRVDKKILDGDVLLKVDEDGSEEVYNCQTLTKLTVKKLRELLRLNPRRMSGLKFSGLPKLKKDFVLALMSGKYETFKKKF